MKIHNWAQIMWGKMREIRGGGKEGRRGGGFSEARRYSSEAKIINYLSIILLFFLNVIIYINK